ncbi:MAG: hypothetical protein E7627_05145 [Ruminococcaceae bacterium]|nr:hypothetical protein [Oscillospiraceae bacterium]
MTYLEIDKALLDITIEMINECKIRANSVSKDNKNEHKALMIELGMYQLCWRAGFLAGTTGTRGGLIEGVRARVIGQILPRYPEINKVFVSLDDDERKMFIAALQAEIYMRDQIYNNYLVELEQAKGAGDTKNIFEFGIKVGAVERVFEAWEEWRVENNLFPGLLKEGLR